MAFDELYESHRYEIKDLSYMFLWVTSEHLKVISYPFISNDFSSILNSYDVAYNIWNKFLSR